MFAEFQDELKKAVSARGNRHSYSDDLTMMKCGDDDDDDDDVGFTVPCLSKICSLYCIILLVYSELQTYLESVCLFS